MNEADDSSQHLNVPIGPDAEVLRANSRLGKNCRCLSKYQSGATDGVTTEVNEMPIVSVSIVARVLTHRRHEHPIGKRQVSNRERVKQAGHGRRSEVGSHRSEINNPNATYEQSSNSSREEKNFTKSRRRRGGTNRAYDWFMRR